MEEFKFGEAKYLVEGDGGTEEGVDDVGVVVELLVHHEAEDAHLGGTAVVELDGELLVEGLLVPARCCDLGLLDLILAGSVSTLDEGNGEEGAEDGLDGEVSEGLEASANLGEVVAGGEGLGEAVASGGHEVAEDGKLGDAAVLGLHKAEAVEALLVSVGKETKGIPEAEGGLGTDLALEAHLEGRAGASHAGGGEGRGGGEEGGEEGGAVVGVKGCDSKKRERERKRRKDIGENNVDKEKKSPNDATVSPLCYNSLYITHRSILGAQGIDRSPLLLCKPCFFAKISTESASIQEWKNCSAAPPKHEARPDIMITCIDE